MWRASTGCAFLTYQTRAAAEECIERYHDKVALPPVRQPPDSLWRHRLTLVCWVASQMTKTLQVRPADGETGT